MFYFNRFVLMRIYIYVVLLMLPSLSLAGKQAINESIADFHLELNEHNQVIIKALKQVAPDSPLNLAHSFAINGMPIVFNFKAGVAVLPAHLGKLSLLYIGPMQQPVNTIAAKMYFLFDLFGKKQLIQTPLWLIVCIPIGLIVLGFLVRKLLVYALIIGLIYLMINKETSLSLFLQAIYDWFARLLPSFA